LVALTNHGDYSWKDVQVEVRYFDKDQKLIDARVFETARSVIMGHGELALAIESNPCQPETNYSSHAVFVRHARSSHSFF
jgi:hypothetical protein